MTNLHSYIGVHGTARHFHQVVLQRANAIAFHCHLGILDLGEPNKATKDNLVLHIKLNFLTGEPPQYIPNIVNLHYQLFGNECNGRKGVSMLVHLEGLEVCGFSISSSSVFDLTFLYNHFSIQNSKKMPYLIYTAQDCRKGKISFGYIMKKPQVTHFQLRHEGRSYDKIFARTLRVRHVIVGIKSLMADRWLGYMPPTPSTI